MANSRLPNAGICDGRFGTEEIARSGRSFHRAPLCSIYRTLFKTSRLSFQGLPRTSWRRVKGGIRGPMIVHCPSVNSFRLVIIAIIIAEPGIYGTASNTLRFFIFHISTKPEGSFSLSLVRLEKRTDTNFLHQLESCRINP